jgi:hypothetical protein
VSDSSSLAAEIKAELMSRDVWAFGAGVFPGSQHLFSSVFSSGFDGASLPPVGEEEIAEITGACQTCLDLTLRRIEFNVTCFIWEVTEAVVAAVVAGFLASDIKLMM